MLQVTRFFSFLCFLFFLLIFFLPLLILCFKFVCFFNIYKFSGRGVCGKRGVILTLSPHSALSPFLLQNIFRSTLGISNRSLFPYFKEQIVDVCYFFLLQNIFRSTLGISNRSLFPYFKEQIVDVCYFFYLNL